MPVTVNQKFSNALAGQPLVSGAVVVSGSLTITAANAATYDGAVVNASAAA